MVFIEFCIGTNFSLEGVQGDKTLLNHMHYPDKFLTSYFGVINFKKLYFASKAWGVVAQVSRARGSC